MSDVVLAWADRNRFWLFGFVLLLQVLGFNGRWRMEPDSALYLAIGRNLAEGRGYTYHGQPHRLVSPGPPVLFAATFRVFGSQTLLPALILMPLLGLATLGLTYRLFLLCSGRPTAVMVTFGLGITRLFHRYCFELLSDLPFLLGVMAFLVGYEAAFFPRRGESRPRPRWYDWGLLVGGLGMAIVMRPTMWVLLAAVVVSILLDTARRQAARRQLIVCAAVAAAAAVFYLLDPRHTGGRADSYEDGFFQLKLAHPASMLHDMIRLNVPQLFESSMAKALFGCPIGPGVNTLAGIVVIGLGILLLRERIVWGLWVLFTIGMLLVFKPLDRYFLPVAPLLVFGWWRLLCGLNHRLKGQAGDLLFLFLLIAGASTNLARMGEMIVEQRRVPFLAHYKEGMYESSPRVAKLVQRYTEPDAWVLAPPKFGRILSFMSRRNVFEPGEAVVPNPAVDEIYALEPVGEVAQSWMDASRLDTGPPIGRAISDRLSRAPWVLHQVGPRGEGPGPSKRPG